MNNKQEEKKTPRGRKMLYGIAFALILWCVVFDVFKVTDPSDPKFDPYKFKFTDYSPLELGNAFKRLFSPGVDRAFIENVLVSIGGAEVSRINKHTQNVGENVIYGFKWPLVYIRKGIPDIFFFVGTPGIEVQYDLDNRIMAWRSSVGSSINICTFEAIDLERARSNPTGNEQTRRNFEERIKAGYAEEHCEKN